MSELSLKRKEQTVRKFMFGFIATLFVVFAAAPASAEYTENPPEKDPDQVYTTSTPVECTIHNNTYATVPDAWAYYVGDKIDFEITLSDSENRVERVVFSAGPVGKHGHIEEVFDQSITWSPTTAGEWPIYFQLFDADGQEIIPTGYCNGAVTVLEYVEPAHSDHPDTDAPATEPESTDSPEDDAISVECSNGESPSQVVISPDGAFCATELVEVPVQVNDVSSSVQSSTAHEPVVVELPRTGMGLIIATMVGVVSLLSGGLLLFARKYLPYARPVKR